MGIIKDVATHSKDKAVSKILTVFGDKLMGRYGNVLDIRLDSRDRRIEIDMLLKGESAPVSIRIENYEIVSEGQRHFITCSDIQVSREWMRMLAHDLILGRRFEIPSKYARLLDILI